MKLSWVAVVLMISLAVSTSPSGAQTSDGKKPAKAIPQEIGKKVVANYTDLVRVSYDEALKDARELKRAIHEFTAKPSAAGFEAAKKAWIQARGSYSPTEAFRFYGGPIDDAKTGPEGMINAWPIDEAYIDYVKGNPNAGIINNPDEFPQITKDVLTALNEKNGEKNISTGFHAIEFLLWGQDHDVKKSGNRAWTDYAPGTASRNPERRAQYLRLLSELLEEHIAQVAVAWKPGAEGNYADLLRKEPLDESLRKIYTGIITLSIDEMAGERMTVSLEKNDQENEQNCFSDTTTADMLNNQQGIQRVYYGKFKDVQGPGIHDLVLAVDPAQARKTDLALKASYEKLKALPQRFDSVIAAKPSHPSRKAAMKTISALEDQARAIAKPGLDMGLILNIQ